MYTHSVLVHGHLNISALYVNLFTLYAVHVSYIYMHVHVHVHAASDMSVHVRQYARYLTCYAAGYKTLAMDVCRAPKG